MTSFDFFFFFLEVAMSFFDVLETSVLFLRAGRSFCSNGPQAWKLAYPIYLPEVRKFTHLPALILVQHKENHHD